MPLRLVGKQSIHRGKYLFELLRNLKDFGVGRMIARNMYERYPEPCYYIVHKVQPEMDEEGRLGTAAGEHIFRGRSLGIIEMEGAELADWKLIPKELEAEYKVATKPHILNVKPQRIVPADMSLPPLLRKIHINDAKKAGKAAEEDPRIPLFIKRDRRNPILQEGVEVPLGTIATLAENPLNTPAPESVAGKLWLSHRKPAK